MNYNDILKQTLAITDKTANYIKNERNKFSNEVFEVKSHNSFVTHVDKNAEHLLLESLSKIVPNSGFLAEESGESNKNSEFLWIIDPLDGTTNYIHSLYPVAISIALMHNNKPVLGVIHEVGLNEVFMPQKTTRRT